MADFDPKAYLSAPASQSPDFDPKAYLSSGPEYGPSYEPSKIPLDIGAADTRLAHTGRWLGGGFGDNVLAGLQAVQDKMHDKTGKTTLGDAYRRNLAFDTKALDDSDTLHPKEKWEGDALGVAGNLLVPMGVAKAGATLLATGANAATKAAPGLLARLAARAGTNALLGGGKAALDETDKFQPGQYGDYAKDVAGQAGLSALAGEALNGTAKLGGWGLKKLVNGVAERSDAARYLMRNGVPLTVGQQAPRSFLNSLEDAATSAHLGGHGLEHTRGLSREAWENAAMSTGRAPGAPAIDGETAAQKLDSVYQPFSKAYDAVGAHPVAPVAAHEGQMMTLPEAMRAAATGDGTAASNEDIAAVQRFLGNQSSRLVTRLNGEPITASDLIDLRSDIRSAGRNAVSQRQLDKATLLRNAEDKLTESLHAQLPAEASKTLRGIDSQYAKYKQLEDAVARSGDQVSQLTPSKLSASVKAGMASKGAYARGGGGDLRELARAGRETLDSVVPKTGFGAAKYPFHTENVAAPIFNRINNSPGAQDFLFGETPTQERMQDMGDAVRPYLPSRGAMSHGAAMAAALLGKRKDSSP